MTDADPREERAQKMIRVQDIELDIIAESGGVTPRRSEIIWCDIARDLLGLIHDLRKAVDDAINAGIRVADNCREEHPSEWHHDDGKWHLLADIRADRAEAELSDLRDVLRALPEPMWEMPEGLPRCRYCESEYDAEVPGLGMQTKFITTHRPNCAWLVVEDQRT